MLGQWRPDPFGAALACVLLLLWWRPSAPPRPRGRSLQLLLGAAALVLLTSGPLNVYGKVLVSAHVLQHVLLLVPAGVLLGCAMTVPPRLRTLLEGRWPLAALLAAAGPLLLAACYISPPLLRAALDSHAAHLALQLLALAAGAHPRGDLPAPLLGVRARVGGVGAGEREPCLQARVAAGGVHVVDVVLDEGAQAQALGLQDDGGQDRARWAQGGHGELPGSQDSVPQA